MRIVIAGETYFPAFNGQAVFMMNLAEGLCHLNHEVLVLAPRLKGTSPLTFRNGVEVHYLPSIPLSLVHPDAYFAPFPGGKINGIFRRFNPQVVHIQDHYPISWGAYTAARQLGIPVIGTNHFMPQNLAPFFPSLPPLQAVIYRILWRWMLALYNHLDLVTAPSRTAVHILQSNGLRVPAYPVSCGIDLQRFQPNPSIDRIFWRKRYELAEDRVLFGFVGRVDREKRLDVLLAALKHLGRPDIQLVVFGKGSALPDYQRMAAKMNLTDQVRFTNFVPAHHLPALLNSIDIFVMPSQAELLSIATLEAMACGKPVLAANSQALPALVGDGINGKLFKPGDPIDAARCMAELADHREQWPRMGQASLQRVQRHNLQKTLLIYQEIYETACSQRWPAAWRPLSQPTTKRHHPASLFGLKNSSD